MVVGFIVVHVCAVMQRARPLRFTPCAPCCAALDAFFSHLPVTHTHRALALARARARAAGTRRVRGRMGNLPSGGACLPGWCPRWVGRGSSLGVPGERMGAAVAVCLLPCDMLPAMEMGRRRPWCCSLGGCLFQVEQQPLKTSPVALNPLVWHCSREGCCFNPWAADQVCAGEGPERHHRPHLLPHHLHL